MNHLTSLVTPVQLISNQHGSNSTQLGMQSWSKWSVQNGVERWLKCLWKWHGGWCPVRLSEYFYFRKYWSTGIFPSKQSLGCTENALKRENIQWDEILWGKCLVCARSQRRMDILLWAKRKATVTKITPCCKNGLQRSISEEPTLKQISYSNRKPHHMTLLPSKNRKRRIRWSDESQFLLQHSNSRIKI